MQVITQGNSIHYRFQRCSQKGGEPPPFVTAMESIHEQIKESIQN